MHISFVRSITMDSWNPKQMKKMEVGGNSAFKRVLDDFGIASLPQRDKFNTRAVEWYRNCISSQSENEALPPPPTVADGRIPVHTISTPSSVSGNYGTPREYLSNASNLPSTQTDPTESVGDLINTAFSWVGVKVKTAAQKVQEDGWAETLGNALNSVAEKADKAFKTVTDEKFIESVKSRASIVGKWVAEDSTNVAPSGRDQSAYLSSVTTGRMEAVGSDGTRRGNYFSDSRVEFGSPPVPQVAAVSVAPVLPPKKEDDDFWNELR